MVSGFGDSFIPVILACGWGGGGFGAVACCSLLRRCQKRAGVPGIFPLGVFVRPRAARLGSDRSRRFPSGVAAVQAFQYGISANLQNGTVNYLEDRLRATPSVTFLMPALTTLLLICNSRSLTEVKVM